MFRTPAFLKVCLPFLGILFLPTVSLAQSAFELFERVAPSPELALLANDPERFEKQALTALRRLSRGNDPLSLGTIEQNRAERVAWRISDRLRLVGTLDLNGDGHVTFEEGEQAAEYKAHLEGRHRNFLKVVDQNSDGLLTREEIYAYAQNYADTYPELARETGADMLRFDLNGDQSVSPSEIQSYVQAIRTLLENQPGEEQVCTLPPRSLVPSYKLIVINETDQIDEQGRPIAVLSKEFGSLATPALIVSRNPVVLKFEGDAALATTLIVTDDVIDVVGLPAENVLRVSKSLCTTYSGEDWLAHTAYLNRGRIIRVLGKMKKSSYDVGSFIYW